MSTLKIEAGDADLFPIEYLSSNAEPTGVEQRWTGRTNMTSTDRTLLSIAEAGWFPDPLQIHDLRYFDGHEWTEHVTHRGPQPCQGCHSPEAAAPRREDRRSQIS